MTVQGIVRPGEAFDSYLGIPFAKPRRSSSGSIAMIDKLAVDELRWKPSEAFDFSQTESVNGTAYRSACIQLSTFGSNSPTPDNDGGAGQSEDCLYLNVFTPPGASEEPGTLPVIVTM